jgi:hypothetical protein
MARQMNDNPYSPPKAVVEDQEGPVSLERPAVVVLAVRLLWAGFAISLATSIYNLFVLPAGVPVAIVVVISVVGLGIAFALSYWLFTAAWRGKGWARWVIAGLILFAIGVVALMWKAVPNPTVGSWQTAGSFVVRMTLYTAAVAMLFSPGANAWYREKARWL